MTQLANGRNQRFPNVKLYINLLLLDILYVELYHIKKVESRLKINKYFAIFNIVNISYILR